MPRARRRATSTSPSPPPSPRAAPSVSTRLLRRRRLAAKTFTNSQKVQITEVWVVDVVVVMHCSCWLYGPKQGQRNISFAWRVVWKDMRWDIQGYFRSYTCICRILGLFVYLSLITLQHHFEIRKRASRENVGAIFFPIAAIFVQIKDLPVLGPYHYVLVTLKYCSEYRHQHYIYISLLVSKQTLTNIEPAPKIWS